MDFIEGLPASKGKSIVFVMVNRLSKYAHFIPLAHPYTATSVAQVFFEQVFKLHGLPRSIVCDRDATFTSSFWRELFKMQGTNFNLSSSYHPQTDRQTEVVNHTLEMYLRCFCGERPRTWVNWLAWAEYCYNTSKHSVIGKLPFEFVYGREPPSRLQYVPGTARVQAVEDCLLERDRFIRELRDRLVAAQNRMKLIYDRSHMDREFQVGDWVYLRLQPYRQVTVSKRVSQKLAPKYYGPYLILGRIGKVAYRLQLPEGSRVHPVFHVSLLKLKVGGHDSTSGLLPELPLIPKPEPERVVNHRTKGQREKVLVAWRGEPDEEAT